MELVIIGNSGSGKTWLATRLAVAAAVPVVHLDTIFWLPGGFDRKRPAQEVGSLVEEARRGTAWMVEGVFGGLAAQFLEDADALLWLDMDGAVCQRRLVQRGSESKAHMDRAQSEAGLAQLLAWAATYPSRSDLCSHAGHSKLFEQFGGAKACLRGEDEAVRLVDLVARVGVGVALNC